MGRELLERIEDVRRRIGAACERAGRGASSVRLVAVSKTHPAADITAAIAAGLTLFGENKVQEAEGKIVEVGRDAAEWHLIGHLQSNKARKAVGLFDMIHTIDSVELVERLDRICDEDGRDELAVLIQVDPGVEETKSGVDEAGLDALAAAVVTTRHLTLRGLMTMPPYFDDPEKARPYFSRLRELRDGLVAAGHTEATELSMGMSHDLEAAIEEGATLVRVGTAIFGERGA